MLGCSQAVGKVYVRADGLPCYYFMGKALVPAEKRGRWLITDLSVLKVDCAYCGMKVGHPCAGAFEESMTTSTHWVRRTDAGRKK
jgi:hypothetical protein